MSTSATLPGTSSQSCDELPWCLHERASDTDPRSLIRCPAGACDLLRRNLQCREPIIIPRQSAPEVVSQHVFRDDVKPESEQVQHAWMQLINRVIDVAAIPEAHTNLPLCVKHLGQVSACHLHCPTVCSRDVSARSRKSSRIVAASASADPPPPYTEWPTLLTHLIDLTCLTYTSCARIDSINK